MYYSAASLGKFGRTHLAFKPLISSPSAKFMRYFYCNMYGANKAHRIYKAYSTLWNSSKFVHMWQDQGRLMPMRKYTYFLAT